MPRKTLSALAIAAVAVLAAVALLVGGVPAPLRDSLPHSGDPTTTPPASDHPSGPRDRVDPTADEVGPPVRPRDGDGQVADPGRTPRPVAPGWSEVEPILAAAVESAEQDGLTLNLCVRSLDTDVERQVCAGDDDPMYAASVPKVAFAVAALEAYGGDPKARTPDGGTVAEDLEAAITVSDNDAATRLARLSASGPRAVASEPFPAINAITSRVGLEKEFRAGNFFTLFDPSPGFGEITASGSVRYLAELVRAADDRRHPGSAMLTTPKVARYVLTVMHRQQRVSKIPGRLLAGSTANKTGETDLVSHDIAVVNTATGRYAVASTSSVAGLGYTCDELVAETAEKVVESLGGAVAF